HERRGLLGLALANHVAADEPLREPLARVARLGPHDAAAGEVDRPERVPPLDGEDAALSLDPVAVDEPWQRRARRGRVAPTRARGETEHADKDRCVARARVRSDSDCHWGPPEEKAQCWCGIEAILLHMSGPAYTYRFR